MTSHSLRPGVSNLRDPKASVVSTNRVEGCIKINQFFAELLTMLLTLLQLTLRMAEAVMISFFLSIQLSIYCASWTPLT